ncbi:MAG: hypothetical protein VXZ82_18485 [Planctomycetota bacterium]|nr:hypothetical protein [Planctomycetota bacterium]
MTVPSGTSKIAAMFFSEQSAKNRNSITWRCSDGKSATTYRICSAESLVSTEQAGFNFLMDSSWLSGSMNGSA